MSEIVKLQKTIEAKNKVKSDFPWGASLIFIGIFALIFLLPLGKDGIGIFFIFSGFILLLAIISTFLKSNANNGDNRNSSSNESDDQHSIKVPDLIHDPAYSGHSGNIYN